MSAPRTSSAALMPLTQAAITAGLWPPGVPVLFAATCPPSALDVPRTIGRPRAHTFSALPRRGETRRLDVSGRRPRGRWGGMVTVRYGVAARERDGQSAARSLRPVRVVAAVFGGTYLLSLLATALGGTGEV